MHRFHNLMCNCQRTAVIIPPQILNKKDIANKYFNNTKKYSEILQVTIRRVLFNNRNHNSEAIIHSLRGEYTTNPKKVYQFTILFSFYILCQHRSKPKYVSYPK